MLSVECLELISNSKKTCQLILEKKYSEFKLKFTTVKIYLFNNAVFFMLYLEKWIHNLTDILLWVALQWKFWIKKNPKINEFALNIGKLYLFLSVFFKYLYKKITGTAKYYLNIVMKYADPFQITIVNFMMESPISIIDLAIHLNRLRMLEKAQLFCAFINLVLSMKIVFFLKNLSCDSFFCPNYKGGYVVQLGIIQRLYFQSTLSFLVCIYFITKILEKRITRDQTDFKIYRRQSIIYFIITILWFELGNKIWFLKEDNLTNNRVFRVTTIKELKKISKFFLHERYNNRKYEKSDLKHQGNFFSWVETVTILRTLDSIEDGTILQPQFQKLTFNRFQIHHLEKFYENMENIKPRYMIIGIEINGQNKNIGLDVILSNWNFICSISMFGLSVLEGLLNYYNHTKKAKQNSEKKKDISDEITSHSDEIIQC